MVFDKILIMSNHPSINNYDIIADDIAHPALLYFCLICADPFAKLLKLHFNHQCNDASIYLTSTCLQRVDVDILYAASLVSLSKHSLHCIIEHEYMARGSLHLLRLQLQQNTTGFGFQLVLHHNACLVHLHLSCDFSACLFYCPLFTTVVSREQIFFLLSS